MTSDGNLLPFNTAGLPNANDSHLVPDNQLFLAGDVRANENIELTGSRRCSSASTTASPTASPQRNPTFTDEQIYQPPAPRDRGDAGDHLQRVAAGPARKKRRRALPRLQPQRQSGHRQRVLDGRFPPRPQPCSATMLSSSTTTDDQSPIRSRCQPRFSTRPLFEHNGADPILKYLASDPPPEVDATIVQQLPNFLFGPAGPGRLRPGFAQHPARAAITGSPTTTPCGHRYGSPEGDELRPDHFQCNAAITSSSSAYGTVDNIDAWVGMLGRGPRGRRQHRTAVRARHRQPVRALRDGDRFWFENQFSGEALPTWSTRRSPRSSAATAQQEPAGQRLLLPHEDQRECHCREPPPRPSGGKHCQPAAPAGGAEPDRPVARRRHRGCCQHDSNRRARSLRV